VPRCLTIALGKTLDNLGLALRAAGRYTEAITAHQDAVAAFRAMLTAGADLTGRGADIITADSVTADSVTADSVTADSVTADSVTADSITADANFADRGAGVLTVVLGRALDNLGLALRAAGRYTEAITAHQDAVAAFSAAGDAHGKAIAQENLEKARAEQQAEQW
jgi:tetratricopeptide (TPR) repeat protein